MEPEEAQERLIAVLALGLQAAALGRGIYLAWKSRSWFCAGLRGIVSKSRDAFRTSRDADEAQRIESEVRQRKLQFAQWLFAALLCLALVILYTLQWRLRRGFRSTEMQRMVFWCVLAGAMPMTLRLYVPKMLSASSLNGWYVFSMILCFVCLTPLGTKAQQVVGFSFFWITFLRVPASSFAPRMSLVLLSNLAISILVCVRYSAVTPANGRDAALFIEISGSVFAIFAWLAVQVALTSKVEQQIDHTKLATELNAAKSLLRMTCDAVVELGEDLCLTEDSPELSILLLRGAGSGTLKGVPIIDLMASGEAERVTELLSSSAALDAPVDGTPQPYVANVFNTQLQDSCGSKFSTEVFHVRYKKLDGDCGHLIGLRDFTDQGALATRGGASPSPSASAAASPAVSLQPDAAASSRMAAEEILRLPGPPQVPQVPQPVPQPVPQQVPQAGEAATSASSGSDSQNLMLLELDMETMIFSAASCGLGFMAGRSLREASNEEGIDLLTQTASQVLSLERKGLLTAHFFPFGNLELRWGTSILHRSLIHGTMEILRSTSGGLRLVLCFSWPSGPRAIRRSTRESREGSPRHRESRDGRDERRGHGFNRQRLPTGRTGTAATGVGHSSL
ncbi:unnamed protein product [Durusdinium trenchii]|uniref:Uncharacterized protein n=1 Tax=Durusdinium trenchii TaxID=1381693 RepID=A0ABP0HL64_9DINO